MRNGAYGKEEKVETSSMNKVVEEFELYGKTYRFETGELAKQTTGSVLVTQGETTCLVTAVVSQEEKDYDFFPLTVDFIEKMYAVGRIPGGYLKREGRPSEKAINHCRQFVDFKAERDLAQGIKGADVIYVSSSPNEFQLTEETLEKYAPNAVILHTLPVDENSLSSGITDLPCFLGLEEAYCLPEVEMAALTLLLASK